MLSSGQEVNFDLVVGWGTKEGAKTDSTGFRRRKKMHIYSVLLVSNPLFIPANSGRFCKCSVLPEWGFNTESVSGGG